MSTVTQELWKVLDARDESSQFVSAGSSQPVLAGLTVEGAGAVGFPISAPQAQQLIETAGRPGTLRSGGGHDRRHRCTPRLAT